MPQYRIDRISDELKRVLDRIIREELRDPRVSGTFSITRVEATRDLRHAKVYVSMLESEKRNDMIKALKDVGAEPIYTEYPKVGHNSWDRAYGTAELYPWFLKHTAK